MKNQAVSQREGEFKFIMHGPTPANALKIWEESAVATLLIYRVFTQADWSIEL